MTVKKKRDRGKHNSEVIFLRKTPKDRVKYKITKAGSRTELSYLVLKPDSEHPWVKARVSFNSFKEAVQSIDLYDFSSGAEIFRCTAAGRVKVWPPGEIRIGQGVSDD